MHPTWRVWKHAHGDTASLNFSFTMRIIDMMCSKLAVLASKLGHR